MKLVKQDAVYFSTDRTMPASTRMHPTCVSEDTLDILLRYYKNNQPEQVKKYCVEHGLDEVVFGLLSADVLYVLPITKKSKVLYYNCGLGAEVVATASFADEVWGIDQDSVCISFCRYRKEYAGISNIFFETQELLLEKIQDRSFDVIVCTLVSSCGKEGSLEKIREENKKRLTIAHRLLNPGGTLCIRIENKKSIATFFSKNKYAYTQKEAFKLLSSVGFLNAPSVYAAYPSSSFPRILIPYKDIQGFDFVLRRAMSNKKVMGLLVRLLLRIPGFVKYCRRFFHGYIFCIVK
jgi:2-polyprenyl-3-methyl-5-hydroxy-6-metoxy-1,4-benzoquinol methylase